MAAPVVKRRKPHSRCCYYTATFPVRRDASALVDALAPRNHGAVQGISGGPTPPRPRPGRSRRSDGAALLTRGAAMVETLLKPDVNYPRPVRKGTLKNGLEYVILPNASPAGRFEAHLEVFAGSADEREDQQGIAHLVEHVAYMGSRKRERLFGTGSQTNAYTDFHHTVFYACCPLEAPLPEGALNQLLLGRGGAMLPRALDALCEVLQAQFLPARVEKERAAVLSEMSRSTP